MTEEAASRGDDFQQIPGIGPAIERRLHEVGILTYHQLATTSPAELAERLRNFAGISASRIEQQDWMAQAQELASAEQEQVTNSEQGSGNGQHYATFNIELLLDNNSEVRRTRAVYIQGGEQNSWAGWDRERLLRFVEERAAIEAKAEHAEAAHEPEVESAGTAEEPGAVGARRGARTTKLEPPPAGMRSTLGMAQSATLWDETVDLARMTLRRSEARKPQREQKPTELRFQEYPAPQGRLQLIPTGDNEPRRVLRHGQPFEVTVKLDPGARPFARRRVDYSAELFAQTVDSEELQVAGEAAGTLDAGETVIAFPATVAGPGRYRLEAQLTFTGAGITSITHILRGEIIHVY